jgi:hypothetical protein
MKDTTFLRARVMQATVNGVIEWRVYLDGEIVARFVHYNHAILFRDLLNENDDTKRKKATTPREI